jgi:hypothetical protein
MANEYASFICHFKAAVTSKALILQRMDDVISNGDESDCSNRRSSAHKVNTCGGRKNAHLIYSLDLSLVPQTIGVATLIASTGCQRCSV